MRGVRVRAIVLLGDGPAGRPSRRTTATRPLRLRRGFRDCGGLLSAVLAQLWPYLGPRLARAGADIDVAAPFLVVEAVWIGQGSPRRLEITYSRAAYCSTCQDALAITDPPAAVEAARTAAEHLRRTGAQGYLPAAIANLAYALLLLGHWDAFSSATGTPPMKSSPGPRTPTV